MKDFIPRLREVLKNEKPSDDLNTIILFIDLAHHTAILMDLLKKHFPNSQRVQANTLLINGFTVRIVTNYESQYKTRGFKFIPIWCDI
jgi:hypothetical protein